MKHDGFSVPHDREDCTQLIKSNDGSETPTGRWCDDLRGGQVFMPPFEPSPEEIREACEAIREGWDERTHLQRAGINPDNYFVEVTRGRMSRRDDF